MVFDYTGYNESASAIDSSYRQGRAAETRLGIQGLIPGQQLECAELSGCDACNEQLYVVSVASSVTSFLARTHHKNAHSHNTQVLRRASAACAWAASGASLCRPRWGRPWGRRPSSAPSSARCVYEVYLNACLRPPVDSFAGSPELTFHNYKSIHLMTD